MENLIILFIGIIMGFGLGYLSGMEYPRHKEKLEKDNEIKDDTKHIS